jgi:hypothetical protein
MPTAYELYQKFLNDPAMGLGISPRSRLGSSLNSVARYVQDSVPVFEGAREDLIRRGVNFLPGVVKGQAGLVQRGVDYLLDEPDAVVAPAHPLTQPPSRRPPNLDARGGDFDPMAGTGLSRGGPVADSPVDPNGGFRQFEDRFGKHEGIFFKDSPKTPGDAVALDRMRSQSHVRPLLNVRGDNGGPLSLADMEANQNAMNTLDDYFTNAPQAQRVNELEGLGAERKAEMLSEDPFAIERGKAGIEMDKLLGLEAFKGQVSQGRELERRQAIGAELEQIQRIAQEGQAQIDRMPDGLDKQSAQARLDAGVEAAKQQAREKFGLGAGISASSLYDRTP